MVAPSAPRRLVFETALTEAGWQADVLVASVDGRFTTVEAGSREPDVERVAGAAVPGLANLHSCAIERGLAGLLERYVGTDAASDELAARFIGAVTPDDVEAVTAQAHLEMLEAGFTAVAEFQYLHHGPDGRPYTDLSEISSRVVAGAEQAGIGLTLLPVFQTHGGFGPRPADAEQRRFVCSPDRFRDLLKSVRLAVSFYPGAVCGVAVQSLRTTTIGDIRTLATDCSTHPFHMQVAATDSEVAECLAVTGARPVDYLLDWVAVDERWCLVHPLHLSADERERLARAGAVAGLCPVGEAHRGDGVFDAVPFLDAGGRFGIGTDSNIRMSPADLFRTLEYGQRQRNRARRQLVRPGATVGRVMFDLARLGGAQAAGRAPAAIAVGAAADVVVLDTAHPAFAGRSGDRLLDAWIFLADSTAVRDVWVGGRHLVREGRHRDRARILRRFRTAIDRLASHA